MPNGSDNNLATMWETQAQSLGQEDPLDEGRATQSSVLAGESRGQRSLGGLQSVGSQSQTELTFSLFIQVLRHTYLSEHTSPQKLPEQERKKENPETP